MRARKRLRVRGVATGGASFEELTIAGADVVLPDLSAPARLLALLE